VILFSSPEWFEPQNAGQEAYDVGFVRNYDVDRNNLSILAVVALRAAFGAARPRVLARESKDALQTYRLLAWR
jgi:hypothetical protein